MTDLRGCKRERRALADEFWQGVFWGRDELRLVFCGLRGRSVMTKSGRSRTLPWEGLRLV